MRNPPPVLLLLQHLPIRLTPELCDLCFPASHKKEATHQMQFHSHPLHCLLWFQSSSTQLCRQTVIRNRPSLGCRFWHVSSCWIQIIVALQPCSRQWPINGCGCMCVCLSVSPVGCVPYKNPLVCKCQYERVKGQLFLVELKGWELSFCMWSLCETRVRGTRWVEGLI